MNLLEILAAHGDWLSRGMVGSGRANLRGANLRDVDLRDAVLTGANLTGANLRDADLNGTIGNMREMVSAEFDTWPITAARLPDGTVTLQIGCQRHTLELWSKSDPRWIAAMDPGAPAWWGKWKDVVLAIASQAELS